MLQQVCIMRGKRGRGGGWGTGWLESKGGEGKGGWG